jgi:hypothetical protein
MEPVPATVLMDSMIGATELVAASAESQRAWCDQTMMPIDEIMQGFTDIVPIFFARTKEAGLLGSEAENALSDVSHHFEEMWNQHERALWLEAGLERPEWVEARRLAQRALFLLDPRQTPTETS